MEPINPLHKQKLRVDALQKKAQFNKTKRLKSDIGTRITAGFTWALAKVYSWLPVRVMNHFSQENGFVISAGIAFYFFFSGVAALTALFAIFAIVLTENPDIQNTVVNSISDFAPGLLKTAKTPHGLISPDTLLQGTGLSATAIISFIISLFTGLNLLHYLRLGVRAMFTLPLSLTNYFVLKVKDFFGIILIALTFILSSGISILTSSVLDTLLRLVHANTSASAVLIKWSSVGVTFLVDFLTIIIVVRFISEVKAPWRALVTGAIIGALAMTALRIVGTSAVSGTVNRYPALTPVAVPLILLLWFNVMCTIILISASVMKVLWNDRQEAEEHEWVKQPSKVARALRK